VTPRILGIPRIPIQTTAHVLAHGNEQRTGSGGIRRAAGLKPVRGPERIPDLGAARLLRLLHSGVGFGEQPGRQERK